MTIDDSDQDPYVMKNSMIIVFVNVDDEDFNANDDIASLFVSQEPAKTSDKSGNVMFELGADADDHPLKKILTAFQNKRDARQPLVTCGRYDVKANPTFNIRAYRDVRVCWVYPERAGTWTEALSADVQGIINGQCQDCGKSENFPWFDTFAENRDLRQFRNIGLLRLTAPQVNLMTNLMAWIVATSADEIRRGLDD